MAERAEQLAKDFAMLAERLIAYAKYDINQALEVYKNHLDYASGRFRYAEQSGVNIQTPADLRQHNADLAASLRDIQNLPTLDEVRERVEALREQPVLQQQHSALDSKNPLEQRTDAFAQAEDRHLYPEEYQAGDKLALLGKLGETLARQFAPGVEFESPAYQVLREEANGIQQELAALERDEGIDRADAYLRERDQVIGPAVEPEMLLEGGYGYPSRGEDYEEGMGY